MNLRRIKAFKMFKLMFILLISVSLQKSYASEIASVVTESPYQPTGLTFYWPITIPTFCLTGTPCQQADAAWTGWQLPTLQAEQEVSFTTSNASDFYLGNALNGQFNVNLTPVFQNQSNANVFDELTAKIASRTAVFSTTLNGFATFNASSGDDYYLLFDGTVRGGVTYQLQVSQVPLPAAFCLFGSGVTLLLSFKKRKFT